MQISAAVVLPVSLKPYCSITEEAGVNAPSHLDTTYFSAVLERMVVTEMGRKSDQQTGCVTVSTGVTDR